MGYYQFIEGKKYNRNLLEAVHALVEGKTSGRLSQIDADRIWQYIMNDGIVSATERRTLHYLITHQTWQTNANQWFHNQVNAFPISLRERIETILEEEFALYHTNLVLPMSLSKSAAHVTVEQSLRLALQSFLHQRSENNMLGVVRRKLELEGGLSNLVLPSVINDLMKHATLHLLTDEEQHFEGPSIEYLPPKQESLSKNWVWGLRLHDLPKYFFWAIIDKEGDKETYHYGKSPS